MITGWAQEDASLPIAIDNALKEINWREDNVIIDDKGHQPSIHMQQFLILKQGSVFEEEQLGPIEQYYLPIKRALSQPLR